jgi:hypothetical protein
MNSFSTEWKRLSSAASSSVLVLSALPSAISHLELWLAEIEILSPQRLLIFDVVGQAPYRSRTA